jgi:hypothetical protein
MKTALATVDLEPAAIAARDFARLRLDRERKTIEVMVQFYCHTHPDAAPCPECRKLLDYAKARLASCGFASEKPLCATCAFRCFESTRREQLQTVIGYAGPRLLWRYPWSP